MLSKTILMALTSALFFSCSKDNDRVPVIQTGYFVKAITLYESDEEYMKADFWYDDNNRIIQQVVNDDTLSYKYNNLGQLTDYSVHDDRIYRFEYTSNRISHIRVYDYETEELFSEIPVTFSNGIYTVDGEAVCKIDDRNQLLELPEFDVIFSYGEEAGVHQHLSLSAARYLVDGREQDIPFLDLSLSNQELKGWTANGSTVSAESERDADGLISTVLAQHPSREEVFRWEIDYEERELGD